MRVKDLIMKIDNSGIDVNIFGADKGLIIVVNIDTLKKDLDGKEGMFREICDRNIDKWEINKHGEIISVLLK